MASIGSLGAAASLLPFSALAAASKAASGPARIVSIGGALSEIIYALGAESDLVGVDTTSIYPAAATKLPSVGYARSLAAEGILALAPTHIVATEEAGPPTVMQQLQQTGLPVSILPAEHRYEGVIERIHKLGKILGKDAQAAALAARVQADWQRIAPPIAARKGSAQKAPKVLFVLSHSPSQIVVGGSDTAAQAMIEYAGARNAVQGMKGFKPLNPEALIAAAPDVILFTDQGWQAIGGAAGALRLPGVAQSTAGQKRRFVSLDAMFLLGFGPRIPQAVQALNLAIAKAMQA
jgi:iron complex transport system substrate-binding protein